MARGYDRRIFNRENNLEMAPFDPIAIEAVEEAQQAVGFDLTDADRDKLIDAIMLSCTTDRHSFSYETLIPQISKSDFYSQRNLFLMNIASFLLLV